MLNVNLLENDAALRVVCWWGSYGSKTEKMSV